MADNYIALSIIIVNWNSKDYIRKCLQLVYALTHGIAFEIIIVDNASYDGCGEMLAGEFPSVRFIQGEQNMGFARRIIWVPGSSRGVPCFFESRHRTGQPRCESFVRCNARAGECRGRWRQIAEYRSDASDQLHSILPYDCQSGFGL